VWDLVNGLAASRALGAALELGLFDALARAGDRRPASDELAAAVAADPEAVALLAEVLVALGLLTTDGTTFGLTPVAARYLVTSAPTSMAQLVPLSPGPWRGWAQLAATIRHGAPAPETEADLVAMYPALVRASAPTQRAVAAGVAAVLTERGLWPQEPRIVDLGCGSGAWLTALLHGRPGGSAVGVDLPGVLDVARETVDAAQLGAQVELLADDYLDVDLPAGTADVVVLAHVLRAEPPDRARRLVARALQLLAPAGVVVVADSPRPDPVAGPVHDRDAELAAARHELLLSLTMAAATPGRGLAVADLASWAEAGGGAVTDVLQPVPRQTVVLIRAVQPSTHPVPPSTTER
jgi:SAM-dependent methyltransferase